MYRLVIVSGPNRGSSYSLIDGENSIGRQMDNHIVLTSSKISKRHCAILVTGNEVYFRDESSMNGSFVNGALTKKQALKPGDRISVGEFVLELSRTGGAAQVVPLHGSGNTGAYSNGLGQYTGGMSGNLALASQPGAMAMGQPQLSAVPQYQTQEHVVEEPEDLPGKIKFLFENKLMPTFYGMLMKNDYRSVVAMVFAGLTFVAVVGAIFPMQDLTEQAIKREAMMRARVLSREIADRNLNYVATHTESQIDLSLLDTEETIKLVAITNMSMQVIAPQSRVNQMLAGGPEVPFAIRASKAFQEGMERGTGSIIGDSLAVWVEPLKTTDPNGIRTKVSAMSIVAIDFSNNMLSDGGLGVTYAIGFVVAGLASFLAYWILLRLSMKPFEVLNEDLDRVLRGELPKVTQEFKIEELDNLWDNINSAAQRIPKDGGSEFEGELAPVNWDHETSAVRALSEAANFGFVGFDSGLMTVALNPQFEEVSGIHMDAVGQNLTQMARDNAFVALVRDIQERVSTSPSRSALDNFEFSGVEYQVMAVGIGPLRDPGVALVFKKKE